MRGRYLALEGVEGAGKSTIARRLVEGLLAEGRRALLVREPGGTRLGEEVRRLLLDSEEMGPWAEALLFAAQRAQLAVEVVGPALQRGEWVVTDRSYYSSLAYQGWARGLGIEQVRLVNEAGLGEVVPDLVVVLEVDPEVGLARQQHADRIGGQGVEFQQRVAEGYRRLAEAEPHRVVLIPADGDPAEVTRRVMEVVGS